MDRFIENLGKMLDESRAKKVRKRRARKRANDAEMNLARQIGAAMKSHAMEIERLLPVPWKFSGPLVLDKAGARLGNAYMNNQIEADFGYQIGSGGDVARADFVIGCYSYDSGDGVVCGASVSGFDPSGDEPGVNMEGGSRGAEFDVEAEWKRGKKAFEPSKDLWPLIKAVMKEVKKQMPDYDEVDLHNEEKSTVRSSKSDGAYRRWRDGE